jgi:arylsulfatase A-like enzyme
MSGRSRLTRILVAGGAIAVIALALLVAAGRRRPPSFRPNVLLVTIDTQRADHVAANGYHRPTTPRLDRLAAEGVLFTLAYTPTPTTAPSLASLFTASYPLAHGVLKNGWTLAQQSRTLAEVLRDEGYATAAVVSAFPLARRFGFDQGFEHYDDEFSVEETTLHLRDWEGVKVTAGFDRPAGATTDSVLAWLGREERRPFFLWVHYFDPHAPYSPPRGYRNLVTGDAELPSASLEQQIAAYDGEIRYADEQLGRLVDAVRATAGPAGTLVVVASDHGEGLMQHGLMQHARNLYEELVRIVLVVSWPARLPGGKRWKIPVSILDITPSILALLQISGGGPAGGGHNLALQLSTGKPPPLGRRFFFQRESIPRPDGLVAVAEDGMFAVREKYHKYIENRARGRTELYDMLKDPGETRNIVWGSDKRVAELKGMLNGWLAQHEARLLIPGQTVSPEDREKLRALGYTQ